MWWKRNLQENVVRIVYNVFFLVVVKLLKKKEKKKRKKNRKKLWEISTPIAGHT
jgi:hypothetical protein